MEMLPIPASALQELSEAVAATQYSCPRPLETTPWLAMSTLQKAIRRGREDLALRAAATLLRDAPDRFWRRCGVIAFEDIGIADVGVIAQVVVALGGKTTRAQLGGELKVATAVVSAMAGAAKCRAADDLVMVIDRHPGLAEVRRKFAVLPVRELCRIATGSEALRKRALALAYAIGTGRGSLRRLRLAAGDPKLVFSCLLDAGFPPSAVELARVGYAKIGEPLCCFLPLLGALLPLRPDQFTDDEFPPERSIGDVPTWAFDMFTREGRCAMKKFLARHSPASRWIKQNVPVNQRIEFLGNVVFAVEGGLLRSRLDWSLGEVIREAAEFECQGSGCQDAREILALVRADIPLLDACRAEVVGEASHDR